jgi:hypothetical protein
MGKSVLISALLGLFGCGRNSLPTHIETSEAFRGWLLQHVPLGSNSEDGQRFLANYGFECHTVTGGSFVPEAPPPELGKWQNIDYVYCDLRQRVRLQLVRRWQVSLVQREGRLIEIGVSTGLLGP